MRYSHYEPNQPVTGDASGSNESFFRYVADQVPAGALHGAILLVGANDTRSLALRHAQAALRFDRRVSDWSHAALIVHWALDPSSARGLEITLDPERVVDQVPERNGVTAFRLSRYLDETRYTNLALITLDFGARPESSGTKGSVPAEVETPEARRLAVLKAAMGPNRDRVRYRLWESLAPWARYAYAPESTPNPLLEGVPLPCAALCEYAYEAAGVDLTPGATGNDNCPELLYATVKYWAEGLARVEGVRARIFSVVRDECGLPPRALSKDIEIEIPDLRQAAGGRPGLGARRKKAQAKRKPRSR